MKGIAFAPVLAGAYRGRDIGARTLLIHAVFTREDGSYVQTLCRRVPVDNLADEVAGPATCPRCLSRLT